MKIAYSFFLLFAGVMLSSMALAKPLVVNIDSPVFRKLVMAIPGIVVTDDSKVDNKNVEAAEELAKILEFSGYFNVMNPKAFAGINLKKDSEKAFQKGLKGIGVSKWKSLGAESITFGRMSKVEESIVLELKTVDLNKGKVILGKRYSEIKDIKSVIRRYGDLLLEAYSGKSGLFSKRLVFVGRRAKGAPKQVFVADFDGGNLRQVTQDDATHVSPSWSPDGKGVLYTSFKSGNPDLHYADLQTGNVTIVAKHKGLNSGGRFSPDGKLVVFTGSQKGDADIFLTTPNGGPRRGFIRGSGLDVDPVFSPNGEWLAFVSGRFGNPHIFRAKLKWDQGRVTVVNDKRLTYAGWYNATPAWAPDSSKIAFAGYDKEIDRFDIFIMNPDGKKLERLTLRKGDNESPSWSPNGQMLVFQSNRIGTKDKKGPAQLYVMNRDGGQQRMITTGLYEALTPKWEK